MKRKIPEIRHRISMQDDKEELEIFIFDEIHSFFGVSAEAISRLLADHPDAKTIIVHINSPGGNALDGVAIYNALQTHSATVDVVVEGMALSAASLIAMSGDTIKMAAGSQMMVHEARGMTHGTSADIRKFADIVESTTEQMVAIYAARSGRDKSKVAKDLKDETFMSAEEAVDLGYATEVLEAKALAAHFDLTEIVANADKIPEGLRELASGSILLLEDVVLNGPKDSPSDKDGLGGKLSPSPIAVMSGLAASSPITNMTRKST